MRFGYGKCHRKHTARASGLCDRSKENLGRVLHWLNALVRVKWWGKSPPRPEQSGWHGKPRVEQGQIGGEGRPGPLAPSGRPLERRSDASPRGMIVPRLVGDKIRLTDLPAVFLVLSHSSQYHYASGVVPWLRTHSPILRRRDHYDGIGASNRQT